MYSKKVLNRNSHNKPMMKTKKKKFKIVDPPKPKSKEFRLYDFDTKDIEDHETSTRYFRIQMFGINEKGETCSIFINDYNPFFYFKFPQHWNTDALNEWFYDTRKSLKYSEKDFLSCSVVKKSQLYEFTGNQQFNFALCTFRNIGTLYRVKKLISMNKSYKLYECGIPPLLRFFHIKEISPSGWISIQYEEAEIPDEPMTTTTYEYICNSHCITPLPNKETPVPYKICSMDAEMSSSHGDFPVPVKDYKRPSTQIVDNLQNRLTKTKMSLDMVNLWLKKQLMAIFSKGNDIVDIVYTKDPINKDNIKKKIELCLNCNIEQSESEEKSKKRNTLTDWYSKIESNICDQDEDHEIKDNDKNKKINTKLTIGEVLLNTEYKRLIKIKALNSILTFVFPELKGDEVTFIGTTFLTYGEKEPYRNTCIVVGTCDDIPNTDVICVDNERECLVEWSQLIQDENPDIIIGYNIFGFDYHFMFERSKELDCVDDFCTLSRNLNEPSYNEDCETHEPMLQHSNTKLASGEYDLYYPNIAGRLQIDMMFYFRKEYNFTSYKLDDVAGSMICDDIKGIEIKNNNTYLFSKNLAGLHVDDFIHLEITTYSSNYYKDGKKFKVKQINRDVEIIDHPSIQNGKYNIIVIEGEYNDLDPNKQVLKWGMSKDDVTPQDIFRLSKQSATGRAIVAKYCIQDCNLVHHLMNKVDVLTGYNEMSRICNVPVRFLVFRGQGIKLTSYVAKVCRNYNVLMPDLPKIEDDEGYEGAIVLPPHCKMWGDNPVACVDYSSLYPSISKGWNLSPDSKVWTKTYDLKGNLVKINDITVTSSNIKQLTAHINKYDNMPKYDYIETTFDNFEKKQMFNLNGNPGKTTKIKNGYKVCRWAQYPNNELGIIPCIIGDLLKARKETRVKAANESDPFLANVLDKRQLGYKVTNNSLYGQMGSSVSTFFEKDVAASITSIGRLMITYAKKMIEQIYGDLLYTSKNGRSVRTKASYVYGDTDSVFFTFNLEDSESGEPIRGKEALEWTIEIAQEAAHLCSLFLPPPMKLEYEKTLMSFILLSKKRYVGMLHEFDPNKGKLKYMGLPLKRRDYCDYMKDVYGGILTILMKEPDNIKKAIEFLNKSLVDLTNGNVSINKLALTRSLQSDYKNPQVPHKILADRIGEREPGNKPKPGDRVKFAVIEVSGNAKKKLLGERIETLEYITKNKLNLDNTYYIEKQIMESLLQLFSLAIEKVYEYKNKKLSHEYSDLINGLNALKDKHGDDIENFMKAREKFCSLRIKKLLFEPFLQEVYNKQNGIMTLDKFYKKK